MSGQNVVSDEPPPLITTGSATTPKSKLKIWLFKQHAKQFLNLKFGH